MRVDDKHKDLMRGAWSWADLMQALVESHFRHRLLKTGAVSGLFTDGSIVTRMSIEEKTELKQMAKAAKAAEREYVEALPFDLSQITPGKLGEEIVKATYAGASDKIHLAWLHDATGRKALVEARAVRTLMDRHPKAIWRFAAGRFWQRPVVLLERDGFFRGQFLALAATVPIEPDPLPETASKLLAAVDRGGILHYEPMTNR